MVRRVKLFLPDGSTEYYSVGQVIDGCAVKSITCLGDASIVYFKDKESIEFGDIPYKAYRVSEEDE